MRVGKAGLVAEATAAGVGGAIAALAPWDVATGEDGPPPSEAAVRCAGAKVRAFRASSRAGGDGSVMPHSTRSHTVRGDAPSGAISMGFPARKGRR